jgi:primosomal replication protein N
VIGFIGGEGQRWTIEIDDLLVIQAVEKGRVTPAGIQDGGILYQISSKTSLDDNSTTSSLSIPSICIGTEAKSLIG